MDTDFTTTKRADEVVEGDWLVESDGGLLTVTKVSRVGAMVKILAGSMMQVVCVDLKPSQRVRVAA